MTFRWAVELSRADGSIAYRTPMLPDWEAASRWVRFEGIRRGVLPPVLSSAPGEVEPLWAEKEGAPYVAAFRLSIRGPGGDEQISRTIPARYLVRQIREIARVLGKAGQLEPGEVVYPRLRAVPADRGEPAGGGGSGGFTIEEVPQRLALAETPIGRLASGAEPIDEAAGEDDVPVFLPRSVLDEAEARSREAWEVEAGGILVGRLHRDPALPEIFVEITAQIPAEHAIAAEARLTFTPETWAAAQAAIATRAMGEELVGWWHFHPDFCRRCPAERRRECSLDSTFFSADDVDLHHLCFAQVHQVALLLSATEGGELRRSLFGWRRGMVASRGFYLTNDAPREARVDAKQPGEGVRA